MSRRQMMSAINDTAQECSWHENYVNICAPMQMTISTTHT